jgi:hypothetical protein
MSHEPYKLRFGHGGQCADYIDATGMFTFVFEAEPTALARPGKREVVVLDSTPLKDYQIWSPSSSEDQKRVSFMVARIQDYLRSLGYDVVLQKTA